MAKCLHRADPPRAFGASEKQNSDICVSVTPRYGVLRFGPHETPDDRVQPERFTQVVLLWMMIPTCLSPFSLKDSHHYTTGSERLSSSQPLLLLSNISQSISLGISWGETVIFSFLWSIKCHLTKEMLHRINQTQIRKWHISVSNCIEKSNWFLIAQRNLDDWGTERQMMELLLPDKSMTKNWSP